MSRPRAWWLVMLGRVVVLALAVGAAFALVRSSGAVATGAVVHYRCPMHPEVVTDEPGVCPVCHMALVADADAPASVEGDAHAHGGRDTHLATAERRAFAEPLRVPAWVDADGSVTALVFRDDLVGAEPGLVALFSSANLPREAIDVALAAAPAVDWDRSTVRVRFDAAAGAPGVVPGVEGTLALPARSHELLVVPTDAIVNTPRGPIVVVLDTAQHRFVRRPVEVGRIHVGVTAVLSGLTAGDQVAVGGAFFFGGDPASPEHSP